MKTAPLLLTVLSVLVEVHSQTAPYLTFLGNNIPNHGYVDLNTVGNDDTNGVQCHTDLPSCCSSSQGVHRGDWYFPNGNRLPFPGSGNMYQNRIAQLVVVRYTGSGGTSGIYRCDIETDAVNNNDGHETLYVGLYTSGGECDQLQYEIYCAEYIYFHKCQGMVQLHKHLLQYSYSPRPPEHHSITPPLSIHNS